MPIDSFNCQIPQWKAINLTMWAVLGCWGVADMQKCMLVDRLNRKNNFCGHAFIIEFL